MAVRIADNDSASLSLQDSDVHQQQIGHILDSICHRWAAAWSQDDPQVWTSLYTPEAVYIDHAFFVKCTGHSQLDNHFALWRAANPDFVMTVASCRPYEKLEGGKYRASMRTINKGTFKGDLPSKRASGKRFVFSGVVDLVVRAEDGLIEELQEWYSKEFDSVPSLDNYGTRTGNPKPGVFLG